MKKIVIPIVIIVIFILFALIFDWGRTTQSSIDFNNLATTSTIKQLASNLDMPILVKNIKLCFYTSIWDLSINSVFIRGVGSG